MIKTLYVVHHSHTDIGFTHGQSRIVRWHASFIRQAMQIAARNKDFRWTCEVFYPVEQFWKHASPDEQAQFAALVKSGQIGLTGAYLHFNELGDAPLLEALAQRTRLFSKIGLPIHAAMIADVNGCPLIHARAMAKAGIRFLLTCVHPHHGYVPLNRREALFRWNLGDGQSLLVYNSDHYHTGNELGLAPGAEFNYTAGFSNTVTPFDDGILEHRLPDYLRRVTERGWEHDFLVLGVSGMCTDNSPPSEAVIRRIERWNAAHATEVRIEMVTPGQLDDLITAKNLQIPTYTGDWPDWWCDGPSGDPEAVALFRHAQRQRRWLTTTGHTDGLDQLDESLALFVEHTFGHSADMTTPWNLLCHQLRIRKLGFAADAADRAESMVDAALETLGGTPAAFDPPPIFRITNPTQSTIRDLIALNLESGDPIRWNLSHNVSITRCDTGQLIPHQVVPALRGRRFLVDLTVQPGQSIDLLVQHTDPAPTPDYQYPMLPDGGHDVKEDPADIPPSHLRTDHVDITWKLGEGITQWTALDTGHNLIDPQAGHPAFAVLASRMHADLSAGAQCHRRAKLGRNRNAADAAWSHSKLLRVRDGDSGPHFQSVILDYQLTGCELLQVTLSARRHEPRVDVEVTMHKLGTWDAENVYLALPFTGGDKAQLWIDRGHPMRPGIDQLPGTLLDFMGAQDGLGWSQPDYGIAIAQFDSHLIQLGPLDYGIRTLSGRQPTDWKPKCAYNWLMTNYWETNFTPDVGGFYSFRYSVLWGKHLNQPQAALAACRSATTPLEAFRLKDGKAPAK